MRLPEAVARYYDAVDSGRFGDVLDVLTADVVFAIPRVGEPETSPRAIWRGRDGVQAMLAARGVLPIRHHPALALHEGTSWLIEGSARRERTDEVSAHFMVSVRLDDSGALAQYRAYSCPPLDAAWEHAGDEAVASFPMPSGDRQTWVGAAQVARAMASWPGPSRLHRATLTCHEDGLTLSEGVLESPDGSTVGTSLSRSSHAPDGQLHRHVGFWAATG
jgi:ketosteroid isomerase-like protein